MPDNQDLVDRLVDQGHVEYAIRVALPKGATPEQVKTLKAAGVTEALADITSVLPPRHTWLLEIDETPVDATLTLIWVGVTGSHNL